MSCLPLSLQGLSSEINTCPAQQFSESETNKNESLIKEIVEHFSSQWSHSTSFKQPSILLFYGHPGAGKTSLIHQLQRLLHLNILSINDVRWLVRSKGIVDPIELQTVSLAIQNKLLKHAASTNQSFAIDAGTSKDILPFLQQSVPNSTQVLTFYLKASEKTLLKRVKYREQFKNEYRTTLEEMEESLASTCLDTYSFNFSLYTDVLNIQEETETVIEYLAPYLTQAPLDFASPCSSLTSTVSKALRDLLHDCLLQHSNHLEISVPDTADLYKELDTQEKSVVDLIVKQMSEELDILSPSFRSLKEIARSKERPDILRNYAFYPAKQLIKHTHSDALIDRLLDQYVAETKAGSEHHAQKTNEYLEIHGTTSLSETNIKHFCETALSHLESNHNTWFPFDDNRVILPNYSHYISASYIHSGHYTYLAAQAPISKTASSFWQMVLSHHCPLILTLANPSEFPQYWPNSGERLQVGEYIITGLETETLVVHEDKDLIVRRAFKVTHPTHCWTIQQLHFISWPDGGVTQAYYLHRYIAFIEALAPKEGHYYTTIHCLGGIGRTGTVMAAREINRSFLAHLAQNKNPADFRYWIKRLVYRLRHQRVCMVHTLEQYLLLYQFYEDLLNNPNSE